MDYKVEFTRLAKAFIEARKMTLAEIEQKVRDELVELHRDPEDIPDNFPMNLMFHTVFLGDSYKDPLICVPKDDDTILVDTASYEDAGEINRPDGMLKGRVSMPTPDTEDC